MPKLRGVIGGIKTKIYYQATVLRTCVGAVLRTVRVGLTEVGNEANTIKYSEKKNYVIC